MTTDRIDAITLASNGLLDDAFRLLNVLLTLNECYLSGRQNAELILAHLDALEKEIEELRATATATATAVFKKNNQA